jgi:hypothetical protein
MASNMFPFWNKFSKGFRVSLRDVDSGTIFTMSHLRLHEFHAILDPTKVTHNGALWWMTWRKPALHRVKNCAAESSRSVIGNRRIRICLIILSFRRFFATLLPASGAQWMVTAFDFQRWVGQTRVLHTPADLDRDRMSDKAISSKTSSSDRSFILSFKQCFLMVEESGRSSLSAVNYEDASTVHVQKDPLVQTKHFCRLWNRLNQGFGSGP